MNVLFFNNNEIRVFNPQTKKFWPIDNAHELYIILRMRTYYYFFKAAVCCYHRLQAAPEPGTDILIRAQTLMQNSRCIFGNQRVLGVLGFGQFELYIL